jgi:hypothetical protein
MTDKLSHSFDYHAETDGFLKWMMVHFGSTDKALLDRLSEATSQFHDCELKITVSGVEVDAKAFMDRINSAMNDMVQRRAKELVSDIAGIDELQADIGVLQNSVRRKIRKFATDAGLDYDEKEW